MSFPRWSRLSPLLGLLLFGCFQAPIDADGDCRLLGTCECAQKSDCAAGLECIDGSCQVMPDAGDGRIGVPCTVDAQCETGRCLPAGPGRTSVCTVACDAETSCPGEWECKPTGESNDGGIVGLCVPPYNALCLPCEEDTDCNVFGDRCIEVGGAKVCGRDCTLSGCPSGYECGADQQCVPAAGSCECGDLTVGMGRACRNQNGTGTCFGFELCQADGGWEGCDAPVPSQERCNGVDDDCDGLVDIDDPSIDISALPASPPYPACANGGGGACVGTWSCGEADGGYAWSCNAVAPRPELCNGLDEDCNGTVDEPFLTAGGKYGALEHCGACGYDCQVAVSHLAKTPGAVACELRNGAPTCVPKTCAPGFSPYPPAAPVMCLRAVSSACQTCVADADCGPFGDQCISMGSEPGNWCAQRCDAAAPYPNCTGVVGAQGCCPSGYTCQQQGGDKLCIPKGNSCTCSPSRAGATRACKVDLAGNSCVGVQTCQANGQWTSCDSSTTTVEVCDGTDNDCDGVVDEGFVNTRGSGTWDTDTQCGSCTTNCTAMWNAAIQHAIGGCNAGPGNAPNCEIVACTQEAIAGGGACQVNADCGAGRTCHPVYQQCVRACGVNSDCGTGGVCSNGFCTAACTSDSQCQTQFGKPSSCRAGKCEVLYQFVNADTEPTNGCECPSAQGGVDEPDVYATYPTAGLPYVDRDCDGVDGVAATSLFVRAGAPSGGNGTRAAPYPTISAAINAFNASTHSAILVATGTYNEQVVLKNGVKLFGGYKVDFTGRDLVTYPTIIEATQPDFSNPNHKRGTVNAEGITQSTVIAGFTIRGYDVTFRPGPGVAGRNSYAVYVKNATSALRVVNNHVVGGRGGDAAPATPGGPGNSGTEGSNGRDSKECTTASCANESQPGGAAGTNASCASAIGNAGAASSGNLSPRQGYQPPLGKNGAGGGNARYQNSPDPSLCKYDCSLLNGSTNGQPAQNGTDGVAGAGGAGCGVAAGSIAGDEWVAPGGNQGQLGSSGTGGGGGGAGGIVDNLAATSCTVGKRVGDLGGTGGGGGAGGCGGKPGQGGASGGGSFAVFVVSSAAPATLPVLEGNIIEPGAGGSGGNGGPGGYGGQGGAGGEGGLARLPAWCAGLGGPGGRGGNGGAGSGGGGGCGGAVFGIAGNFLTGTNYLSKNLVSTPTTTAAGSPGAGGASPAGGFAQGATGAPGAFGTLKSF